ncbi:hypothetical protein HYW21_05445 [Candidatus Woesearchaeota archaeon]|nr:hypothetical protein [Candidatus Woesearchaeota archaeon]
MKKNIRVSTVFMMVMILLLVALVSGCTVRQDNENLYGRATDRLTKVDKIDVQEKETVACCTYVDTEGNEKTCRVLTKYDCSLCNAVCQSGGSGSS